MTIANHFSKIFQMRYDIEHKKIKRHRHVSKLFFSHSMSYARERERGGGGVPPPGGKSFQSMSVTQTERSVLV